MDAINKTIRTLLIRRRLLTNAIAALEAYQSGALEAAASSKPGRPGRHDMSREERQQVSERMQRYHAQRREEQPCQN